MELPYDTVKDTVRPGGGYNGFRKIEFSPPLLFGNCYKGSIRIYFTKPYHTLPYPILPYPTIPYHTIPFHTIHTLYVIQCPGALLAAASVDK